MIEAGLLKLLSPGLRSMYYGVSGQVIVYSDLDNEAQAGTIYNIIYRCLVCAFHAW